MLPAEIFSDSAMAATVWPAASSAGKVPLTACASVGAVRSVMVRQVWRELVLGQEQWSAIERKWMRATQRQGQVEVKVKVRAVLPRQTQTEVNAQFGRDDALEPVRLCSSVWLAPLVGDLWGLTCGVGHYLSLDACHSNTSPQRALPRRTRTPQDGPARFLPCSSHLCTYDGSPRTSHGSHATPHQCRARQRRHLRPRASPSRLAASTTRTPQHPRILHKLAQEMSCA